MKKPSLLSAVTGVLSICVAISAGGCACTAKKGDPVPAPSVTAAISSSAPTNAPAAAKLTEEETVSASNRFTLALYGQVAKAEGNLFASPLSATVALAMAATGAKGETEQAMLKALQLPDAQALAGYSSLLGSLNPPASEKRPFELSVANRIWPDASAPLLPVFVDRLKAEFGAEPQSLDYIGNAEGSRKTINAWVEKATRDKIRDLVKPGQVSAETRLVLTNAIYFKGSWTHRFDPKRTEKMPFRLLSGKEVQAQMMRQSPRKHPYYQDDELQALTLPYSGDRLEMVVLLPKKAEGLSALEKSLSAPEGLGKLQSWLDGMRPTEVAVELPKFKLTSDLTLNGALEGLGMGPAFTNQADFSGMTGKKGFTISLVVHKAFVDVNEEGTEAAAATAVVMRATAMPVEPELFRADHPFLYLIRDAQTGVILFIGRLASPKA